MKNTLLLLLTLTLAGCVTTAEQQRLTDFVNSPTGRILIHTAEAAAGAAIDKALAAGKIDSKEIAKAALNGASAELRAKQTPATPASAAEAKDAASEAIHDGTGAPSISKALAPSVAIAVADAVKNHGAPADLALEAAARGLDQAAAGMK